MFATLELSPVTEASHSRSSAASLERRQQSRRPVEGQVWLVNRPGQPELGCQWIDRGGGGARLRVPAGDGVAEGQQYELCECGLGAPLFSQLGALHRRAVQVVRVHVDADDNDHVEVAVVALPHS